MKTRALAMPEYVAELIRLPLERMNLGPSQDNDIISCSLSYESGGVLSLVVMCIGLRRLFRETPTLVISIVELDDNTRAVRVHSKETMPVPTGPDDLPFVLRFSALVRAMAWTLGATSNVGECISLPKRQGSSSA